MKDELVEHLESNGLLKGTQHEFRKGWSCLTNLLSFLDRVTEELDNGGSMDLIYLDFAKAFNKVPVDSEVDKEVLQRDLDRLVQWSEVWQMKFNVDKVIICKGDAFGERKFWGKLYDEWGKLGGDGRGKRSWGKDHERFEGLHTLWVCVHHGEQSAGHDQQNHGV